MEKNVYKNEDGVVVTDSMKIAEAFGMRHSTVLEKARVFISLNYEEYKEDIFEDIRKAVNGSKRYFQFTWKAFQGFIKTFTSPHAEAVLTDFKAEFWSVMHEGMVPVEHEEVEETEANTSGTVAEKPEEEPSGMVATEDTPMTTAEVVLHMAMELVIQEQRVKKLEEKISMMAQMIAARVSVPECKGVEEAMGKAYKEMTERDEVKALVEAYAEAVPGRTIGQAWGYMHAVLQAETGIVVAGERHGYASKIHEVESKGLLPKMLDIARRLVGQNK